MLRLALLVPIFACANTTSLTVFPSSGDRPPEVLVGSTSQFKVDFELCDPPLSVDGGCDDYWFDTIAATSEDPSIGVVASINQPAGTFTVTGVAAGDVTLDVSDRADDAQGIATTYVVHVVP